MCRYGGAEHAAGSCKHCWHAGKCSVYPGAHMPSVNCTKSLFAVNKKGWGGWLSSSHGERQILTATWNWRNISFCNFSKWSRGNRNLAGPLLVPVSGLCLKQCSSEQPSGSFTRNQSKDVTICLYFHDSLLNILRCLIMGEGVVAWMWKCKYIIFRRSKCCFIWTVYFGGKNYKLWITQN